MHRLLLVALCFCSHGTTQSLGETLHAPYPRKQLSTIQVEHNWNITSPSRLIPPTLVAAPAAPAAPAATATATTSAAPTAPAAPAPIAVAFPPGKAAGVPLLLCALGLRHAPVERQLLLACSAPSASSQPASSFLLAHRFHTTKVARKKNQQQPLVDAQPQHTLSCVAKR